MKNGFLALLAGCFLQISAAVVYPPGGSVLGNCNLPDNPPNLVTVFLGSTAGSIQVYGLVERGSFLVEKLYSVVAVPGGAILGIDVLPGAKFLRGHNKSYIGFFTGTDVSNLTYITIDVNCVPQPTISLKTETVDQQITQSSGPTNILLKGEILGSNPGDVAGLTNTPPSNTIAFAMTPDNGAATSPWITLASVPGSPPNTGTVTVNGAQDLTVSVNPAGLSPQATPYIGYLRIRDTSTTFGSADLTIRLQVTPGTGPSILSGGIVPLFSKSTTIEPGSWASIYGSGLSTTNFTWTGDYPTSLGGVSVLVNGKAAYLSFVSPALINFEAPDDGATGPVNVVVIGPSGSATSTVTLGIVGPSLNMLDGTHPAAVILTPDRSGKFGGGAYDVLGPAGAFSFSTRPVRPGETLLLFGTGFGPTTPAVSAGRAFSGAAATVNPVTVTVGGIGVNPIYSVMYATGAYQIAIVVPNAPSGDQPLTLTVANASAPANIVVTMR